MLSFLIPGLLGVFAGYTIGASQKCDAAKPQPPAEPAPGAPKPDKPTGSTGGGASLPGIGGSPGGVLGDIPTTDDQCKAVAAKLPAGAAEKFLEYLGQDASKMKENRDAMLALASQLDLISGTIPEAKTAAMCMRIFAAKAATT